ncbi:ABC transporter ATP-binding protein [Nakamurella endophytica]|uniref:ABC transporter ATP-binding protein n=1 Tax=Nakamurella endophytica TaxID=1748367 RepID=A0A917T9K7_9ACTN|nr:ABC transporter ATP-binding protein [Nakamurella endophytica]GGM15484.1 ABC transporter ATP-binding protein [Nakamurella endophytica]
MTAGRGTGGAAPAAVPLRPSSGTAPGDAPFGPAQQRPALTVQDLRVSYPSASGSAEVVHGVDLSVGRGRTLAVVGESGSGKSVTARAVLRLDPDARVSGRVLLGDTDVLALPRRRLRTVRGARVGLVFQDPLSALNPVMTVGWQIMQPLRFRGVSRAEARRRGIDLLGQLGVRDAARRFDDYPHQFSGGMRQRVVIAIAVIADPEVLIADEPTTALDVRVQAQVLAVLRRLADDRGMSVVLITHDLGIVAGFADDIVVLRSGRVVERGTVDEVYARPHDPYTRGLLGAVPRLDADPSVPLAVVPPETPGPAAGDAAPTQEVTR